MKRKVSEMTNWLSCLAKSALLPTFIFLLCSGCAGSVDTETSLSDMYSEAEVSSSASESTHKADASSGTQIPGAVEIEYPLEFLFPEIPVINEYYQAGYSRSHFENYAFLTDGTGKAPTIIVHEGDEFLDWKVVSIETGFEEYDDGSITIWYTGIHFDGEAKIRAKIEYFSYDKETGFGGFFWAFPHEESKKLLPDLPNRSGTVEFWIYLDESDARFSEIFSESEDYVIDDCIISIRDYKISFAFTDTMDVAELVKVERLGN